VRAPLGSDSGEKHEPADDIDTAVGDWPIREVDIGIACRSFISRGIAAVARERLGTHHREQEQRKKRDAGNCQTRKRPAGLRRAPGEIEYPAHEPASQRRVVLSTMVSNTGLSCDWEEEIVARIPPPRTLL